VIVDGSADEVGIVAYETGSGPTLALVPPASPAVDTFINSLVPGNMTNCGAALQAAVTLMAGSSNGHKFIVFASDGLCNSGPSVGSVAVPEDVVVSSIAIGTGSDCASSGGTGTLQQVARNGGVCSEVPDPGNLPDLIENLIGSTLESLRIQVDGEGQQPIDNADITPDLPQDGAASIDYATSVPGLVPDDHTI
jgi:hypothetical protein